MEKNNTPMLQHSNTPAHLRSITILNLYSKFIRARSSTGSTLLVCGHPWFRIHPGGRNMEPGLSHRAHPPIDAFEPLKNGPPKVRRCSVRRAGWAEYGWSRPLYRQTLRPIVLPRIRNHRHSIRAGATWDLWCVLPGVRKHNHWPILMPLR